MKKHKYKRSALTTNAASATAEPEQKVGYCTFTFNAVTAKLRREKLEGREHLVVPMVMVVEGVLNGSKGSFLYPSEELAKTPESWNHKPVVVYHPTLNGEGISACAPDVINNRKIGVIMNTKYDAMGRLVAEAWIEEKRANAVDKRIMTAVNNKKTLELSTGLFLDIQKKAGEYDGVKYDGIARNYRPDHLAILPDQIGACSVKDGAGFIRNQEGDAQTVTLTLNKGATAVELFPAIREALFEIGVAVNELSFDDITQQLADQIRTRFPTRMNIDNSVQTYGAWIVSTYDTNVVFYYNGKTWELPYSMKKDKAILSDDEPTQVMRTTSYVPVGNGAGVNAADKTKTTQNKQNKNMDRKTVIDGLIANKGWNESQREFLSNLPDERLQYLGGLTGNTAAAPVAAPTAQVVAPAAAPTTSEQVINAAPAALQAELRAALAQLTANKTALVDKIMANKANKFSKEQLVAMNIDNLHAIAALAANEAPAPAAANATQTYAGKADGNPATNAANKDEAKEQPLVAPTCNWKTDKK